MWLNQCIHSSLIALACLLGYELPESRNHAYLVPHSIPRARHSAWHINTGQVRLLSSILRITYWVSVICQACISKECLEVLLYQMLQEETSQTGHCGASGIVMMNETKLEGIKETVWGEEATTWAQNIDNGHKQWNSRYKDVSRIQK